MCFAESARACKSNPTATAMSTTRPHLLRSSIDFTAANHAALVGFVEPHALELSVYTSPRSDNARKRLDFAEVYMMPFLYGTGAGLLPSDGKEGMLFMTFDLDNGTGGVFTSLFFAFGVVFALEAV